MTLDAIESAQDRTPPHAGWRPIRRWGGTRRVPGPVAVIAVVTAIVVAIPLLYLVIQANSRGFDAVVDEVWQRRTLDLAIRSLSLAGVVTVASVAIGTFGAFITTSTDLPFASAMRIALALPLALPSYVAAYGWISWQPSLAGFWGAALVLTSISYPFVLLPASAALRRIDARQDEAARSLGADSSAVFRRLTIHSLRTPVSAGALLVTLYVLSDFGAVATMRFESFTWVIFGAYRAGFNPARAAILSLVLVAIASVLVVGELRIRGRGKATTTGAGAARRPSAMALGRLRWPAFALTVAVLAIALVLPLGSILSMTSSTTATDWSEVRDALVSTLLVAAIATAVVTALAIPMAILAARVRTSWAQATERTVFITHSLPGVVIGLSVVYVGIRLAPGLYQRLPMLILGYVVLFLSLGVGSIRGAVEATPPSLEDVARSLGSTGLGALRLVTIPMVRPAIGASAALVFLTVMKELPATILLRPTGFDTLATELWSRTSVADYAGAAPFALAIVAVATVPATLLTMSKGSR